MSEIMKADFAEAVPFQQLRKLRCDIVRLEPIPNIIYANMKFSRYSRSALSGACDIWLWISRERLLSGDKNLSSRMHEWPVAEAWKGGHAPARATMGFRLFCLP